MIELPALYNTIIGGLIAAVITGISGFVCSLIKKRAAIRKWKEEEEIKGKIELGAERFKLIKSSTFIPTMGQTEEGPHDSDNITISDNRFDLADKILKDIFSPSEDVWKKRFAILGGTGMGKSTFSAYLYYKYINYYKYKKCKYPLYIKYLGQKNVFDDLRKMSENNDVSQSVLILDALDENTEAAKDTQTFLDKIEEITDKYRIVILTSRTQFFPDKRSEPTKGTVLQNSRDYKFLSWKVIYISPFNEEETIRYLEAKYKIPSEQYSKAKKIADLSNDLLMRPMILSFMDDLLDLANNKKILGYEIYARIIDKWLSNECEGQKLDKSDLFDFSKKLSLYIYDKWIQSGDLYITEDEFLIFLSKNNYQNNPYSFRERSLVNRRGDGSIKFSHKSFWEFFLAINSIENPGRSFKPNVFDVAEVFTKEMYELLLSGKNLLNINYSPHLIFEDKGVSSLDSLIENGRKYISDSSIKGNIKDVHLRKLLCKYWELSIQNLSYLYKRMPYKQMVHNSKGEILHHSEKLTAPIDQNLSKLQNCFLNIDQLDNGELFALLEECCQSTRLYSHLPDWGVKKNSKNRMVSLNDKDFVIFPFLYSDQFVKNQLSRNYVHIGIGFNDCEVLYETIKKCSNNTDYIDIVCIYVDGDDIDSHVSFITGLCNYLRDVSSCIVINIKIETAYLYYVVNKLTISYSPEQIKVCLTNMFSLNSITRVQNSKYFKGVSLEENKVN